MITFGEDGFIKKRYRKFDIKTKGGEESITFGMIKSIDGENILVDLNHPLAGHSILLKVKVLKVT